MSVEKHIRSRHTLALLILWLVSCLARGHGALRWKATGGLGRALNYHGPHPLLSIPQLPAKIGSPESSPPVNEVVNGDGNANAREFEEEDERDGGPTTSEEDPAPVPLPKPHLSVHNDYGPEVEGVRSFIQRLERFRTALYEDGNDLYRQFSAAIHGGQQPPPSEQKLADRDFLPLRTITWWPVSCRTKEIHFKKERKLKDSGPEKNTVYLARDVDTGRRYAYKLFGKPDDYTSEVSFFMVMSDHPNVVKPICTQRENGESPGRAGLLLEYIEGESSLEVASHPLTKTSTLQLWAAKLLNVLQAMHRKGFVHADLKPENILIEASTGQLIVIDFGFTVSLPHEHPGRGNFDIKAPEVGYLIEGRLHEGLDMWAYGSTLATWYAYHYLPTWQQARRKRKSDLKPYVMIQVGNGGKYRFGSLPKDFPAPLRAILYLMLAPNPNLRTFSTNEARNFLRKLRFFEGIDWEALDRETQLR